MVAKEKLEISPVKIERKLTGKLQEDYFELKIKNEFRKDGTLKANDLAAGVTGAVVKDPVQDKVIWQEYLKTVVKKRFI